MEKRKGEKELAKIARVANKGEDLIVLVESQRMVDPSVFSPQRLFFLLSSARHFRLELEKAGFDTRYIKAPTTVEGIKEIQREFEGLQVEVSGISIRRIASHFQRTTRGHPT